MNLSILTIILLGIVQGAAELLPISSSAHVIVVEKLLGLPASSPPMTFLLVMLHTGTMFAVLLYFWPRWRKLLRGEGMLTASSFVKAIVFATFATGVLGLLLKKIIEHIIHGKDVETIFGNTHLIAAALLAAGVLIIVADRFDQSSEQRPLTTSRCVGIGLIQGLCLPFRGFSRSGATISLGLVQGLSREFAEDFSFALAVVLTPPVVVIELYRMIKESHGTAITHTAGAVGAHAAHVVTALHYGEMVAPGLLGMVFSFLSGLLALKWLSAWLENGQWKLFGYYCLVAAVVVWLLPV